MAQGFATIVLGMVGQPDRDGLEVIDDGMNMVKHSFEQLVSEFTDASIHSPDTWLLSIVLLGCPGPVEAFSPTGSLR